jgi:hypothetical protein
MRTIGWAMVAAVAIGLAWRSGYLEAYATFFWIALRAG